MIEKDYLKRQIDRFFEELTALLNPKAAKEEERKHLDLLAENTPSTISHISSTPPPKPYFQNTKTILRG